MCKLKLGLQCDKCFLGIYCFGGMWKTKKGKSEMGLKSSLRGSDSQ